MKLFRRWYFGCECMMVQPSSMNSSESTIGNDEVTKIVSCQESSQSCEVNVIWFMVTKCFMMYSSTADSISLG